MAKKYPKLEYYFTNNVWLDSSDIQICSNPKKKFIKPEGVFQHLTTKQCPPMTCTKSSDNEVGSR